MHETLILASGSPYRRELLGRLGLPFEVAAPEIDETPRPAEPAQQTVRRLAAAKARAVAARRPEAVVIGSDQLAALDGEILGKPGTPERARAQLERASGREVAFLTAVAVARGDALEEALETVTVRFRALDAETIARYVEADRPLDCAGAIRSEGLGAALLEAVESRDPAALVGLPLVRVAELLRRYGIRLP
ncbi:septum formation protein Maf [Halorhodospira neutriphila]|uniref:7-methyl-GTP pyrophosphatase n=2 Tax=Halorhodospira neutriphila TaxID=168379 RepID=A0ABS1E3X2_9GAMM|nr:nucleoside triphosphate pyrophosphatase [Halorhodospira neutriphila]MBK1726423.1 septum formation protein Maf [Halorhodospira neutriphila]